MWHGIWQLQFTQQWENYGNIRMKKIDRDKENEPETDKKKNINVYFCIAYSCYFSASIHRVTDKLKNQFNLSWLRAQMSFNRFINLAELLNGYLATKIRRGILSCDLMDREFNCSLPSKVNGK